MSHPHNLMEIVLAVYDPRGTYSQHAGVVMTSIFENTQSPVCVHILHDETLSPFNRQNLRETARRYCQRLDFVDVTEHRKRLDERTLDLVRDNC